MLYVNVPKFWDYTKGYKTPVVFTGGFYRSQAEGHGGTINKSEFTALNREGHKTHNDNTHDDIMFNRTIYRNYTTKPIWIIERCGITYKLNPITHTSMRPCVVKETHREVNTEVLTTFVKYNNSKSTSHIQEIDMTAAENFTKDGYTKKIKCNRYYHILEAEYLDQAEHNVLYWAENDIVIISDSGNATDYLQYIIHPYSPRAKHYPSANRFLESYDTIGRAIRHNLAFCIVDNSETLKHQWMPFGKDAIEIPIIKDTSFMDGFYMFQDEMVGPNTKAQPCHILSLVEARAKYGIADTREEAIKWLDQLKLQEEFKLQQKKADIEREKIRSAEEQIRLNKDLEDLKRTHAQEKMQHENEMEKRIREMNERKMEEDRQKQIRAQASERRSNNVSLIKEVVGFGVAILGIAAIIIKARK